MTDLTYLTPQTDDGTIRKVIDPAGGRCKVLIEIPLTDQFRAIVDGRSAELVFAARSRIARLGYDVTPTSTIEIAGSVARLEATIDTVIPSYGTGPFLAKIAQSGLRIGRLVFCPQEHRLDSEAILREMQAGAVQLPERFSIDDAGNFTIQPHRKVYEWARPLTEADVFSIVLTADGRSVLNRLQIPRDQDPITMKPQTGVITSCSMFLHKHYVVLDRERHHLGRHLQAIVLDPVRTRGTRVFLEFTNCSTTTIVNPSVTARMYAPMPVPSTPRAFPVTLPAKLSLAKQGDAAFAAVNRLFDRLETRVGPDYYDRMVAVVDDWAAVQAGGDPKWIGFGQRESREGIDGLRASRDYTRGKQRFGTEILAAVPESTRGTALLGYFPNLIEHLDLCAAARAGKIDRIVFRRASYEHGPFLSAKDQARLADYDSLGIEVSWCNLDWKHLATHVFRGLRGYFVEPRHEARFHRALIIAIYGSTRPLSASDATNLRELLAGLKSLFGDNLAILTGGGPGAMQQAADIAHDLGLLVGANYIETVDQGTNKSAEFYQCFQDISRHNRQRWFEIASFQIFCTGGLGTLEEIGLTLTDMKLGVIERAPLVFFGRHAGEPYWRDLVGQFETMVADGRAPDWVLANVLLTDDPAAVPPFYKRILELG